MNRIITLLSFWFIFLAGMSVAEPTLANGGPTVEEVKAYRA